MSGNISTKLILNFLFKYLAPWIQQPNSKITYLNFHEFFDQLEQVWHVLYVY